MGIVATILIGYVLGSVPVSSLVARRHGVDLHATGDGNPGAWNALEQLGAERAWPAFAGDAAKALLAGLAGQALGGWWTAWAGVAAAMVGHAAPVFARFRGGKSVMAFVGGSFALAPAAAFLALGVCLGVTAASAFKWGARTAVFGFPLIQLAVDPVEHVAGTGILMCLIGALFGLGRLRRRSAPATSSPGARPTA
jgi:glycerol-3-phosphate acyltransferase PlsY